MKQLITIGMMTLVSALAFACGGNDEKEGGDGDGDTSGDGDTGAGASTGGDGDTGAGASTGGDGDAGMAPSNPCDPSDATGGEATDTCPDYTACVTNSCQPAYQECFGANYLSGDFAGSPCQEMMDCATACQSGDVCDENCATACTPSAECASCILDTVATCVINNCQSPLTECYGSAGGDGDLSSLDRTCADLQACCDSLTGEAQTGCQQTYDLSSIGGDLACSAALTGYTASSQCL